MGRELPRPILDAAQSGGIPYLTDEALFAQCGVRIGFFGREGGLSEGAYASLNTGDHVGDDLALVWKNRALALDALGFAGAQLVVPKQVHGTDVVAVDDAGEDAVAAAVALAEAGADAVQVGVPGVAALLSFADCLPLVLVAPSGRFSVVHAGWRGALAGIAGIAARSLAQVGGEDPAGFNAYIGPHIRSECFETSEELAGQFTEAFGEGVLEDGCHVSVARVVATDLERAGVLAERIVDVGICTVCDTEHYFSYRAEGVCGRQATVAVRK